MPVSALAPAKWRDKKKKNLLKPESLMVFSRVCNINSKKKKILKQRERSPVGSVLRDSVHATQMLSRKERLRSDVIMMAA